MPATKRYLDPELIARLGPLELRARRAVAGSYAGMHRSAYHGYSVEFAEHRQYVPGDDVRYVDWRLFGKQDRFYIKEYEAETNLRCNFLVDASASMSYAGEGGQRSKYDYGAQLAAALAYLLTMQQDSIGLITFDSRVRARLPESTGKRHMSEFVKLLEQTVPEQRTDVKVLFHRLAEELGKRSIVVLISDLLADPDDVVSGLEHICYAGHELILLHVMHDHEWHLPFVDNALFEGLEDDVRLMADPQSLRESYVRAVERFTRRVREACLRHRADYVPVNTSDAPAAVLTAYLAQRAGLSR